MGESMANVKLVNFFLCKNMLFACQGLDYFCGAPDLQDLFDTLLIMGKVLNNSCVFLSTFLNMGQIYNIVRDKITTNRLSVSS
jgi:hypothetical protein